MDLCISLRRIAPEAAEFVRASTDSENTRQDLKLGLTSAKLRIDSKMEWKDL